MKNYILVFVTFLLTACAVTKKQAPIEYNHNNANFGHTKSVNENTISSINNENEVISSQLQELDSLETTEPSHNIIDDENNVMPAEKTLTSRDHEPDKEEKKISEPIKIVTKKVEESKKQLTLPQNAQYIKPVEGKVITKFGEKTETGANKGINIAAPVGTKIVASASGKIIYADYDATFGNLVLIKLDSKNIVLSYSHMEDLMVTKGDNIKQGEIVGYVGSTGKVKQPQLHFAIREGKNTIDPLKFLNY